MICTHCKTQNYRDYKFCRECGARLDAGGLKIQAPGQLPGELPGDTAAGDERRVAELLDQGFALLDQAKETEALALVQQALAICPESASAHSLLGVIYERQGRMAEAAHQFELVSVLNPDSAADKEKLNQLLASSTAAASAGVRAPEPEWRARLQQLSPAQVGFAAAIVCGLLAVTAGMLVTSNSAAEGRRNRNAQVAASGNTPGTSLPGARLPAPPPAVLPGSPNQPGSPVVVPTPPPSDPGARLNRTTVAGPGSASVPAPRTDLPRFNLTQPPPGGPAMNGAAPTGPNAALTPGTQGLAPAPIRAIAPLPFQPPPGMPGGQPGPEAAAAPKSGANGQGEGSRAPAEPSEPGSGFIRIEPLGTRPAERPLGAAAAPGTGGTAAPRPEPARPAAAAPANPGISVRIEQNAGYSPLADAQRAERLGFQALRKRDREEARRQYTNALRLYSAVVDQGGSGSRQAQEGLETCRKVLASLRPVQ